MNPDVVTFLLILLVNFVITFLYWLFFFVIQDLDKTIVLHFLTY